MDELLKNTNMNRKQTGNTVMENSIKKEWRKPELETLNVQETAQGPLPPPEPS
jgi:hypothetical protein